MKMAGMLLAVALLLAAVGAVFVWTSGPDEADLGDYRAESIGELCDSVDTGAFDELAPNNEGASSTSDDNGDPPIFNCEIRLVGEGTDYVTITLTVKARVAETISDAENLWEGLLEVENSEDHDVSKIQDLGDAAVAVALPESDETTECRVHSRDSNVVLSSTALLNGGGLGCDEDMAALLTDISGSTLDVMRSE